MSGRQRSWVAIGDVSVTKVGGRWNVYVAEHWHLCRVSKERTVFEIGAAFTQLQRDESMEGGEPGAFVDRVGVRYVAERIVMDPEARAVLLARILTRGQRPCMYPVTSDAI